MKKYNLKNQNILSASKKERDELKLKQRFNGLTDSEKERLRDLSKFISSIDD